MLTEDTILPRCFATLATRCLAVAALFASMAMAASPACAAWSELLSGGAAPVRSIARRADGRLIGPINTGRSIELWISDREGIRWAKYAIITRDEAVEYGDPMVLAIPGTGTVFCAAREHGADGKWRILTYRSNDSGATWRQDGAVAGPSDRFVGAPFLFLRRNGDLQCYYDSEQLAADRGFPGFQWIVMQGRNGLTGPWDKYGMVVASRERDPGILTRDGMATVVSLGGDRLLCVTEGVETRGHGGANVVRAIPSADGGRTWDYSKRSILYQSRVDPVTNRQYNAYVPYAIQLSNGELLVAFATDEDYDGSPDFSHHPPHVRHAHIKAIRSRDNGRTWSPPEVVWSRSFSTYHPGLFERRPLEVLCTVDRFGRQAILLRPASLWVADALMISRRHDAQAVHNLRAVLGLYQP